MATIGQSAERPPAATGNPKVTPGDLELADQWYQELVPEGRQEVRWDWTLLVAEEIAEARALGLPAREKVERLVRIARGLGPFESGQ